MEKPEEYLMKRSKRKLKAEGITFKSEPKEQLYDVECIITEG